MGSTELFNGWVEREVKVLESELQGAIQQGNTQLVNYINGRLFEIKLIEELMPR